MTVRVAGVWGGRVVAGGTDTVALRVPAGLVLRVLACRDGRRVQVGPRQPGQPPPPAPPRRNCLLHPILSPPPPPGATAGISLRQVAGSWGADAPRWGVGAGTRRAGEPGGRAPVLGGRRGPRVRVPGARLAPGLGKGGGRGGQRGSVICAEGTVRSR